MALRAPDRLSQPDRAHRPHPVREHPRLVIFGLRPAFFGREKQPIESRSHLLLQTAVGQQIPGELFPRELIVALVLIERPDDIIAVRPNVARVVRVVTDRVGEPRHVQPTDSHAFAIVRRGQEPFHQLAVGIRRFVFLKSRNFFRLGRQTDEIEIQPPCQRAPVPLGRWLEPQLFEVPLHQNVYPAATRRNRRFDRRQISPMLLIFRSLGDPGAQQLPLCLCERPVRRRRRHLVIRVSRENAPDQLALLRLAGDERLFGQRFFPNVQAELALPFVRVRPVTKETFVRENRSDISVVRDFFGRLRSQRLEAERDP